jgi:hypothetical protein
MDRRELTSSTARRGITLLELLIAGTLGLVVVLALGQVDATRIYLSDKVRTSNTSTTEAAMAMTQMVRTMQQADRVIVDTGLESVQVRIPIDRTNLDADAGYQWIQFRRDAVTGKVVQFNPDGSCAVMAQYGACGSSADDACFTVLAFSYQDEAVAPPGGDPSLQDNNLLQVELQWTDPKSGRTQWYQDQVTLRAGAYSNVNTQSGGGIKDSGTGLAPSGVAVPPGAC